MSVFVSVYHISHWVFNQKKKHNRFSLQATAVCFRWRLTAFFCLYHLMNDGVWKKSHLSLTLAATFYRARLPLACYSIQNIDIKTSRLRTECSTVFDDALRCHRCDAIWLICFRLNWMFEESSIASIKVLLTCRSVSFWKMNDLISALSQRENKLNIESIENRNNGFPSKIKVLSKDRQQQQNDDWNSFIHSNRMFREWVCGIYI